MINYPPGFIETIAHIRHEDGPDTYIFQVVNQDGTDWDEEATAAAYQAWLEANT